VSSVLTASVSSVLTEPVCLHQVTRVPVSFMAAVRHRFPVNRAVGVNTCNYM
jgi:hypothetical protein